MKILYITTSTELGGAEKALADLAVASAKEHTVRVLSLRPAGEVANFLQKQGIEVISLGLTKKTWPGKIIKQIQQQLVDFQPDLVHAMLYWGIELARLACAGRNIKLISSPHFDMSKRPLYQRVLDFLLKGPDALTVAESLSTATYLINHQKYKKNKVFLLPNGANSAQFFKDENLRKSMREKLKFTDENVVFTQVSRLEPVKNPILLLQAFRNVARVCPQARLVFVGDGTERQKLETFIEEAKLSSHVLLVGQQSNINDWLNMADVFVLPSNEESLPLALLEALSVGLPCVVTSVGDMPLWVEHGKNGFVFPPQDITLLSCFLTELSAQAQQRKEQGEISLNKSTKILAVSPQYQQLYKQIYNGSFHVKTNQNEK